MYIVYYSLLVWRTILINLPSSILIVYSSMHILQCKIQQYIHGYPHSLHELQIVSMQEARE